MTKAMQTAETVATAESCTRCRTPLNGSAYEVRTDESTVLRCFRCAVTHGPLMRRSLIVALIVGTLLTAINQGTLIFAGDFPANLAWKVPLTYVVPYCVTTTGAILNARRRLREMEA